MNQFDKIEDIDLFLKKILLNPFIYIFEFKEDQFQLHQLFHQKEDDISDILYSEEKKIIQLFLRPIEIVLRPHINITQEILNKIAIAKKSPLTEKIIDQYGADLADKIEMIRRFYRIYIESNNQAFLEKEAEKLVKRFFGEQYSENHKNFIKLKRFFEKLKTFHEKVSSLWNDIAKLLETFTYIREIKTTFEPIKEGYIPQIFTLIRQTETFLNLLQKFLKINQINYDSHNQSYIVHLAYEDSIDYTLDGFYESFLKPNNKTFIEEKINKLVQEPKEKKLPETLVLNLENEQRKNKKIFTLLLGSKDWNQSKDYYLELENSEYQTDLQKFYQSFCIVLDEEKFNQSLQFHSHSQKVLPKEELQTLFNQYVTLIQEICISIYEEIINKDFIGILKPPIFFYHIGANTVFSILKEELRLKNLGEILYIKNNLVFREYPYGIIKRIFIDWYNDLIIVLDKEEIDSYIIYSQQYEFVLSEYIRDYQKVMEYQRKNFPNVKPSEFDKWFLSNYTKMISINKFYIYKRFFPGLLFNLGEKKELFRYNLKIHN